MKSRRLLKLKTPVAMASLLVCLASVATASDMELSLQVKSAKLRVGNKHTAEEPSSTKPEKRPVFTSSEKEPLKITWKVSNVGKKDTFEDVLIHCVVVAEKEVGQQAVPSPKEADPLQESAITMDFKPGLSASGEFTLVVEQPGNYLVRVETRNMLAKHGHEHSVSLDLVRN